MRKEPIRSPLTLNMQLFSLLAAFGAFGAVSPTPTLLPFQQNSLYDKHSQLLLC